MAEKSDDNQYYYFVHQGAHRHQRLNRFYYQPSTFLASYEPPVYMSEEDEDSMSYDADSVSSNHDAAEEDNVSVSERPLGTICKEKRISPLLRVSISSRYDISCRK